MGTAYRDRRSHLFGSFLKAVVIVLAVMLFWGTFLWVGLDMHLPTAARQAEVAEAVAVVEEAAEEGAELDT